MGRYLRESDPNLEGQRYRFAANRETKSKIWPSWFRPWTNQIGVYGENMLLFCYIGVQLTQNR